MKKSKLARNGVILLVSGATLLFACWLNSHLMFRSMFDPLTASYLFVALIIPAVLIALGLLIPGAVILLFLSGNLVARMGGRGLAGGGFVLCLCSMIAGVLWSFRP